ncbi:MAG TPA: S4 domain-containing protein [Xanthobacteraceae bacterium]|nr:S4 domain-containing protein [Xanthobacteraceae bacterium]
MSDERQRIDKWLWHARVVRTRSAAAALAASGHVRLNGGRVDAPARPVKIGDVVTVALDRRVRVLKVLRFADRRASAAVTEGLYEDLSPGLGPPDAPPADNALRSPGAGRRPTKQDRRAIDRLLGRDEPH